MKSGSSIDIKEHKNVEEKLRLLVQYAQDAIIQMNSDGLVTFWNKSAERLFGYTEKEMLGKNLHILIVPERYHKAYKIGFSKFKKSGQGAAINKTLELKGIRKDGAEFPIELSLSAVRVKGEWNTIGIIRDITSRKIAEKQLKESEKRYKIQSKELELILDNIPALIFYKDDRNNLIRVNKYFADAHKATKEALAGKNCFDIYPEDVAQKYFDDDLEVIKSKKPKLSFIEPWDVAEGRKSVNSNKIPLYEDDDKCIGIIGFSTDVTEQVKAKLKLKESEEKYRYLMDGITSVGIGIDIVTKDYKILFQNQVLKEKFGDITGKLCYEKYMGLKTPCDFCPMIKALKNNTIESTELIAADGNSYELFSAPYLDSDRTTDKVIEIVMNITERKQAEMALQESKEKYRSLFDNAQVGLYWSRISDGKFLECNNTFAKLFGYDTREECLVDYITLEHYVDLNTRNEMLEEIRVNKKVKNYEIHVTKRDGTPIWLSISARMFEKEDRIEGAAIDITMHKEAERNLKKSEEKYRTILESIKEGYFEVDLYGNFEFINNSLCEIIGYSKNELLSMNYENLCDEENKRFIFQTYNNLYKEGKGSTLFDFVQIKKNGERIYEESSVYLKFNSQGEIIGFKGLIRDITERKKTEILRRKFQQELEKEVQYRTKELNNALEKQKLYLDQIEKSSRFKTEFMGTLSHELRTPLNAIIGFTDLLLESAFGELNEEQLEFVKDIDESSNLLLDMITNILDISRIESGQVTLIVEEIHLNNLVNHAISTLKPLYDEKGLIIDLKGLKKEQLIFADRIKFKQIIYNLLSNAIKFTKKGKVTFEFRDSRDTWEFVVKDTGIGIAEKDFNIIFKEFQRVKSAYIDSIPGSGLGLALSKRIVNLHGGDILFTSKLGKGTTFTFTIPKSLRKKVNSEKIVESFLKKI